MDLRVPSACRSSAGGIYLRKDRWSSTVWFAFPIAEAFAIIFSGVCLVHVYRKEIIPLKAQQGK